MVPVGEAGDDDAVHVGQDRLQGLRPRGGRRRQGRAHLARTYARQDGQLLHPFEVTRDPVHEAPAFGVMLPEYSLFSASLSVIGAATCLSGVISFRRAKTSVNPTKPYATSSLVVSGIYKYTRNPMYLGFLLLLLGWATFLSNLAPFALLPAFVVYMNHFQIRPEERALGSLFAQEYHAYHARVRRWI